MPGPAPPRPPRWAALQARASMQAGLLHLLVPTDEDSAPDWQSEFILSVLSMLHVLSSCLWGRGTDGHRENKDEKEMGKLCFP